MAYRLAPGCYPGSIIKVIDSDGYTTTPSDSTLYRWARKGWVEDIGRFVLTRKGYNEIPC